MHRRPRPEPRRMRLLGALLLAAALAPPGASAGEPSAPRPGPGGPAALQGTVRILFLHHSTGAKVWAGGVPEAMKAWNGAHGTDYRIAEREYPDTAGGYPWANYPYDYWNLWVDHRGASRDRGELNLDDLAASADVIVFKHCFPVSGVGPDAGDAHAASKARTLANYRLQYQALKARLRELPGKRFIVWTGAALRREETDEASALRARAFATWVKEQWDEPGDNVFVWDFRELETGGGLYLLPANAKKDSHPNAAFGARVAPLLARRIADVIEGRGDTGSRTGAD